MNKEEIIKVCNQRIDNAKKFRDMFVEILIELDSEDRYDSSEIKTIKNLNGPQLLAWVDDTIENSVVYKELTKTDA